MLCMKYSITPYTPQQLFSFSISFIIVLSLTLSKNYCISLTSPPSFIAKSLSSTKSFSRHKNRQKPAPPEHGVQTHLNCNLCSGGASPLASSVILRLLILHNHLGQHPCILGAPFFRQMNPILQIIICRISIQTDSVICI